MKKRSIVVLISIFFTLTLFLSAYAIDTEITRKTMNGLQGVCVTVENIQPNIQKYAQKAGVTREQMQKDIETKLKSAGIKALNREEWLTAPGKPMLYVNVNTHEYEKYWYAYDIKVELQQVVSLEMNPSIKTMADTWSTNMTGIANIGTLNLIRNNVGVLSERFINAYKSVNGKKQ
ncbi:MAG: hypothetical protein NT178_04465 [Proteobacteria bacterium]|nr:hypothetical protein [Pseudomonadota bacterium]